MAWLLVVRHGPAEDPRSGQPDGDRALTEAGRAWTRSAFRALPAPGRAPGRILASPYLRAQQTAALLAEASPGAWGPIETWDDLVPSGDAVLLEDRIRSEFRAAPEDHGLVVVTHQPLVADLVARLAGRRLGFPPAGWASLAFEDGRFQLQASSEVRP